MMNYGIIRLHGIADGHLTKYGQLRKFWCFVLRKFSPIVPDCCSGIGVLMVRRPVPNPGGTYVSPTSKPPPPQNKKGWDQHCYMVPLRGNSDTVNGITTPHAIFITLPYPCLDVLPVVKRASFA